MSDLARAMTSSSELCFRRALTDTPTRVDCRGGGWAGAATGPHPHGAGQEASKGAECPCGTWGPQ